MTPLHWAIEQGFNNVAELLLENGASYLGPQATSKFFKTPYSIAKEKKNEYIIELIEHIQSSEGKSQLACSKNSINFNKTYRYEELKSVTSKNLKRSKVNLNEAIETKRLKSSYGCENSGHNMTLKLLEEQISIMSKVDDSFIQSAIQSGRKIMLTEAGKRLLNDSKLNKSVKFPINTTMSSHLSSAIETPRSSTITSRLLIPDPVDTSKVGETFRENVESINLPNKSNLETIRLDLPEVILNESSRTNFVQQSNAANNVSSKEQQKCSTETRALKQKFLEIQQQSDEKKSQFGTTCQQLSELSNNYNQLKKSLQEEQQKNLSFSRQLKMMEINFENFKRQQNEKFDSILKMLSENNNKRSGLP